jgi:hypothetical protein
MEGRCLYFLSKRHIIENRVFHHKITCIKLYIQGGVSSFIVVD